MFLEEIIFKTHTYIREHNHFELESKVSDPVAIMGLRDFGKKGKVPEKIILTLMPDTLKDDYLFS